MNVIIFLLVDGNTYVNTEILKSNFWARTECSRKENTYDSFTKIASGVSQQPHICVHTV